MSQRKLEAMTQRELFQGILDLVIEKELCRSCLVWKQTRQAFSQNTMYQAAKVLQLIHGDLCGPITPQTLAGSRYILVLIDDHSQYMWTSMLKEKCETLEKFKRFKLLVE